VPTRANAQHAFGCYLPDTQTAIARAFGLMVLTLEGDQVSAITWFGGNSVFPHFGLPRAARLATSSRVPALLLRAEAVA
jgi:hypothetical protein